MYERSAEAKLREAIQILDLPGRDIRQRLHLAGLKLFEVEDNLSELSPSTLPRYREILERLTSAEVDTGQIQASLRAMSNEQLTRLERDMRELAEDVHRFSIS